MRWSMDKSSSLGCPCHSKNYPRSTSVKAWGCPRIPSSSTNYQVLFQCAIFLLLHMICVTLGASLFLFLVFFCFVCCNKWLDHIIHVLKEMFSSLYFVEIYLWELFQNKLIGVGDEFYIYSDANGSLFRLWHVPWLVMLGVILHV